MLARVKLLLINAAAHLCLYTLPRFFHTLLIRAPVTLWELVTGRRPLTYSPQQRRHINVVTTSKDTTASSRLKRLCGLHDHMQYTDPLYNGVVSTILAALRTGRRVQYEREYVPAKDGNPICLDWLRVPKGADGEDVCRGIVLLVPGFGNYGQTPFLQRAARQAVRHGYHVCVLTPRGIGSAPLTTPQLTCVTFTADIRTALRARFTQDRLKADVGRDVPLYALGYSAGASSLIKTIAEEVQSPDYATAYPRGFPISLCVSMNGPYDMEVHADAMLSRVGRLFFQSALVTALDRFTKKHWAVLKNGIPGLPQRSEADMKARMSRLKTVEDFEEYVLCPHMGYPHRVDYYKDAYAPKWAKQIGHDVTLVCVAARDDPVVGYGVTSEHWQEVADAQPNVAYVETPAGGHLGYLRGPLDEFFEAASFLVSFPFAVMDAFTKEHTTAAR